MKKLLSILAVVTVTVAAFFALAPTAKKANAQVTSALPGYGYYTGQNTGAYAPGDVAPVQTQFDAYGYPLPVWAPGGGTGGLENEFTTGTSMDNANKFIGLVGAMLNDTSWGLCAAHLPVGSYDQSVYSNACIKRKTDTQWASYMVNVMMSYPSGFFFSCSRSNAAIPDPWDNYICGIENAKAEFNKWADYIRYYAAQGWIEWHSLQSFGVGHLNSINVFAGEDNEWFNAAEAETSWSIVFHNPPTAANPAGSAFIIKKWCGNVTGEATPLTPPPQGNVVDGDCNRLVGWAYDPKRYAGPNPFVTKIKVYKDLIPFVSPGTEVTPPGGVLANQPGPNGESPYPGILLPGNHGFNVNISAYADGAPHTYIVVGVATDAFGNETGTYQLNFSPITITTADCVNPTCTPLDIIAGGGAVLSNVAEPGDPFAIRVNFGFVGSPPPNPFDYTIRLNLPGGPITSPVRHYPADGTSYTFNGLTDLVPGEKNATWSISVAGGITKNCPDDGGSGGRYIIGLKPYFKAYGGDVRAGGAFSNTAGCAATDPNAGIYALSRGSGNTYAGASSQYAAFALGRIGAFFTAGARGGMATEPQQPSGLAFGNTGPGVGTNGDMGGSFGQAQCVHDYYGGHPAELDSDDNAYTLSSASPENVWISPASGTLAITAPAAISGKHAIYVNGNVVIRRSAAIPGIRYAGYSSIADIPSVFIIASGNIYIENTVTELAGVYVAQPNATAPGIIYTCTTASGALFADNQLYSNCNQRLVINGAFVAQQARLQRTFGTLRSAGVNELWGANNAAEVFKAGPELYLSQPSSTIKKSMDKPYDSITSLPPIL